MDILEVLILYFARMDLKLEKEEFAELINRTFIENVSVQSSDNSVYVVISASRRKKLQDRLCRSLRKSMDRLYGLFHI